MKQSSNEALNVIRAICAPLMVAAGAALGLVAGFLLFFCFKDCTPTEENGRAVTALVGALGGVGLGAAVYPKGYEHAIRVTGITIGVLVILGLIVIVM